MATTVEELKKEYPKLTERLIKEARGEDTESTILITRDLKGRMSVWTEETKDLDGALVSKRVDNYSYYDTGEIDIITLRTFDSKLNKTSEKQVKHLKDHKPPVVATLNISKKG